MRQVRREATEEGHPDGPQDADMVSLDWDEDAPSLDPAESEFPMATGPADSAPRSAPVGDEADSPGHTEFDETSSEIDLPSDPLEPVEQAVRPFADLPELPADLAEAFDTFKLAILRHKLDGWNQVSRSDVLASLESLKQLALAPA